ncbi:hypothetical protein Mgra_00007858 [Meloidogyne graminicola]|uniref:Uncharacterized protein n=1 Tax=Meloidogyne graminicola TaxID=189291 RepID=A0A8S9ZHH3_9BILA|nr:hypothetical protein Mgra_00007858 [Meloidogyne graminicola]
MPEGFNNNKSPNFSSQQNFSSELNKNNNNKQNNYLNNYQKTTKYSFKNSMENNNSNINNNKQTKNSTQQKSPYISNFWISVRTLKSISSSSSSQRPLLGHNATERLHQLQQQQQQQQIPSPSSQSPSSLSSPSSSAINSEDQINLENQQQNLGSVDSVAVRTANYLMEMKRTQEGKKLINNNNNLFSPFEYKNNCGRVTPFPSPSIEQQQQQQQFFDEIQSSIFSENNLENINLINNNNNCGRFPTIELENNLKPLQLNIICELNNNNNNFLQKTIISSLTSSYSPSSSSSISELPQPVPKHHLREQLLKIKQKNIFIGNSFFGGISNNPFFFGQQKQQQKQRKLLPTAKQLLIHSSSPNFPQTNTVINRVVEFEEKQQKNNISKSFDQKILNKTSNIQLKNSKNIKKLSSTSTSSNNNLNNRLSPKSSLFCKKPVIVIDLGLENEENIKKEKEEIKNNEENNLNKLINLSSEKSKSVTALIKLNNSSTKYFQFTIQKYFLGNKIINF